MTEEIAETEEQETGTEAEAEESQEGTETEDGAEFDADRALDKIRKLNSENKNLREAKKKAEEEAATVGDKDKRIKALEAENLRIRIGAKHGLPDALIDRLKGDTEEEILADAEQLLAVVAGKRPPTNKPKERLRGGTEPAEEPEETDPRKLAALIPRR